VNGESNICLTESPFPWQYLETGLYLHVVLAVKVFPCCLFATLQMITHLCDSAIYWKSTVWTLQCY